MCHEYHEQGMVISGNYEIDPDGEGGDPPFMAHCDFDRGKNNPYFKYLFACWYFVLLKYL